MRGTGEIRLYDGTELDLVVEEMAWVALTVVRTRWRCLLKLLGARACGVNPLDFSTDVKVQLSPFTYAKGGPSRKSLIMTIC